MNLGDAIGFARKTGICFMATREEGQPRVRPVSVMDEESGFYFATVEGKRMHRQLLDNPLVEACFYDPTTPSDGGTVLRVAGDVEFVDDLEMKARILGKSPVLQGIFSGPDDVHYILYRIAHGEARFWTMADFGKEDRIRGIPF
ncbi:pyridoxamine 5'-phosphate oxidase family protein [Methanolinea mesophila]|uniref:pyridoxamine 5'-phosphate oxidase family protein n=1 Tax=Methanolinea mesophila TaxID=547055 RepID=UPI001FD7D4C9|nr:pyridoxamine 5'-phosphate oxidase family protein [Methanolinea mesophila]